MTELSVIICAHNPDAERLQRVLTALAPQVRATRAQLILVDNASSPELTPPSAPDLPVKLVREGRTGLTHARAAGIRASNGGILVFVDDDNILAPDYLAQALEISRQHEAVGVFAGRSMGEFGKTPGWPAKHHLARLAVRDLGPARIEGPGTSSDIWTPFGAGMVIRRLVAERFLAIYDENGGGIPLGRNGSDLISGEDTLLCRISAHCDLAVAYEPDLCLTHVIPASRLSLGYVWRLLEAQGRSQAILDAIDGVTRDQPDDLGPVTYLLRFLRRCRNPGLHEAITHWAWDRGYAAGRSSLDPAAIRQLRHSLNVAA